MEEGELNLGYEPELAVKQMEEWNLPDPPLVEPEVQVERDIEMWEPKRETPTDIEIFSQDEEENWRSHYDVYGYGDEFVRRWSDEKDFEKEVDEAPTNYPRVIDSESAGASSGSSSNSGEDEDDEDFDITNYDESTDFWDAWR